MAVGQTKTGSSRSGLAARLFTEHPRSLGMSWISHGAGALKIGVALVGAGAACMVHAAVPGWFTETAGRTVIRLHAHMKKRKAAAADPDQWPDYEI